MAQHIGKEHTVYSYKTVSKPFQYKESTAKKDVIPGKPSDRDIKGDLMYKWDKHNSSNAW